MCHSPWLSSSRRFLFLSGLLVVVLGLIGCGGSTGTITGTVTYNGTPLKGGRVTFLSTEDKKGKTGEISEDGTYKVEKVPVGPVVILVETEYLKRSSAYSKMSSAPPDAKFKNATSGEDNSRRYTAIPRQYSSPAESDLKYTVKRGTQEHPLALTVPSAGGGGGGIGVVDKPP